jgi:hypothetical protein
MDLNPETLAKIYRMVSPENSKLNLLWEFPSTVFKIPS